jgi:uncharacterized OB-fold protein
MGSESMANIPPIYPDIFTMPPYEENPPELLGGHCPSCKQHYFPKPTFCPKCLGPVEQAKLGSEGTIYTYTVIRTKAPMGLPEPYGVGYIDLKVSELRIFCLLDPGAVDDLSVGMPVRLRVGPIGKDVNGNPCLRPYFTPLKTPV